MQSKHLNFSKSNLNVLIAAFFVTLLAFLPVVSAISASDARQDWLDAKQDSKDAQQAHRLAKAEHGANSDEALDTGKESLNAALDEAEAWLVWKEAQTNENSEIPDDLREDILNDIDANKGRIEQLRDDVDAVENNLELGVTFLRMIGEYIGLLTDVARDSGKIWVFIAEKRVEDLEEFEGKLRTIAENQDNDEAIKDLNEAMQELGEAKTQMGRAEDSYEKVYVGSNPLINFHQGNQYLRVAKTHLLKVHLNLRDALGELSK